MNDLIDSPSERYVCENDHSLLLDSRSKSIAKSASSCDAFVGETPSLLTLAMEARRGYASSGVSFWLPREPLHMQRPVRKSGGLDEGGGTSSVFRLSTEQYKSQRAIR